MESIYFGYFSYNIFSNFENLSVFLAIISKLISWLTEINFIEINFSSSENLQYVLNNCIFFIFSSFIILSFSFNFNSNSLIYFSNLFILIWYSSFCLSNDTFIILLFSLLSLKLSFIKSKNVFDSCFNYIYKIN